MTIGELDRRVGIYSVSTSANSYGELTRSYSLFRTVWAAIEWKGGTEKMDESDKITGMTKLHIYIRNLDMSNLSLQSKLVYDSKDYFPKVINQIDGRTAFLEIICENKD
jgi:head-tail adaptor|tara:strand:- start:1045 stop:1371 length:327 start_codon:yes stop_codon:yes gene_type:complete